MSQERNEERTANGVDPASAPAATAVPPQGPRAALERRPRKGLGWINWLILLVVLGASAWWFHLRPEPVRPTTAPVAGVRDGGVAPSAGASTAPRAAMSVTTVRPAAADWATRLTADGSIAAWQEVSISPEVAGFRIAEVLVNVGDRVRSGQALAVLSSSSVANDLASQTAALAESRAALAEASANAARARQLADSGAISAQQVNQYFTAEVTAKARVQAAQARIRSEELRMTQTRVVATDDGVIAVRAGTVGAVAQAGQELFRLIRQGRLEWRANVPAADLSRVRAGQPVRITLPDGNPVDGSVRTVAPTIDPQTRNGMVYVDLKVTAGGESAARAGMFARGEFELGSSRALTVPASSVLVRDGFSYLFKVGADNKVSIAKVRTGRRQDDRVEIIDGLATEETLVESGVGFLADGDVVTVARTAP